MTDINEIENEDGINNDINVDVDNNRVGGINDGINDDTDSIDTNANDGINVDVDVDNNNVGDGGINNDTDSTDTGVNNGINIDNGINTDINVDVDTQTQPAQEDDGAVDETRILEALLFASDELLTPAKLKAILPGSPDTRHIRKMVGGINERLLTEGHPFEIIEAGGGYQFRTLAAYHPYVRKLYKERAAKKLSLQALECLAIIAYRQPISKAEVEAIRGVLSDGAMKTLLERKLIDLCGRSDKPGRPWLYGTTSDFLRYFGINKIGDLPRMEEFEQMARAKMEEMSAEELSGDKEVTAEEGAAIEVGTDESAAGEPIPTETETPPEANEL